MFCPQCSQQQVSNEVRFCPRCGFPLDGVAQLLASGGVLQSPAGEGELAPPSPRLKGVRQGALLWLLGMIVVPLMILLSEELRVVPEAVPVAAAIIFFVGGFARLVYALLFEDGPLRRKRRPALAPQPGVPQQQLGEARARRDAAALPPPQDVPANAYVPPRADTSEITQRPPSVTENTTRLLDDQQRRQ